MKKLLFLTIFTLLSLIGIKEAKADGFQISLNRTEYYRYYQDSYLPLGERYGHFSTFDINNKVAYCIEPNISTADELDGYWKSETPDHPLSIDTIRKLRLIAYYGFDYPGHNTMKYRMATQLLIWEVAAADTNYSDRNFNFINFYEADEETILDISLEYNTIKSLVEKDLILPSFNRTSITDARIGEEIVITDTNGVLSNGYSIDEATDCGNDNATCRIVDNELHIIPNTTKTITVGVKKEYNLYSDSEIFYNNGEYQDLIVAGAYPDNYDEIIISATGGSVEINKVDAETTIAQGNATLKGAKYGVYTVNGELITTITTDENGYAKTDNILDYGEYYIQEISASDGYLLDSTKYNFSINKNSEKIDISLNVKEKVIKNKLKIFKVFASSETGIMTGEPNIIFDIYLKSSNEKIATITTDENGYAEISLAYGIYIVKQINSTPNYEKVDDFEITIDEKSGDISKVLSNAGLNARIKVIKVDMDTGNKIALKGIKFKIFDLSKNEYVCQITNTKQCIFETNEDGILITPLPLSSGKYRLEEVDQSINGYLWNDVPLIFEISEDSNLVNDETFGAILEIEFANKEVKGQIEIQKFGEEVIFENNTFKYNAIPLENIKFGLYDEFGNLIRIVNTDENGYVKIENLKLGKYILRELETLDGYVLDSKEYEIILEYVDQYTPIINYEISIKNYLGKGRLELTKVDLSTGTPLPNTLIEVYNEEDKLIFSGRTDENGKIIIDNLVVGKYYLLEREALDGYNINSEKMYFEIKENGEIVKSTMTNELIVDVPDTDISDFNVLNIIGIVVIIFGLGYKCFEKVRKK